MKGDISADFHAPEKRFSGVRAQAGRVLTDADFNAAVDVIDNRLEDLVRTLLCAAGSPDSGLKVQTAAAVNIVGPGGAAIQTWEFQVAPGTFVLGGRATLLNSAIDSRAQSDWVSQILTPGVLPPAPVAGRTDLVWLQQTEYPVRAVEDRELQERALGSADTTTRLRPNLRLRVLDDVPPECHLAAATLTAELQSGGHGVSPDNTEILSAARLGLAFVDDGATLDPCAPGGLRGYLGDENHTLKIMLTAPGRFVWAWDHGEPLYRVLVDAASGEIEFLTEPKDPVLYPTPDQIIEILPWDVFLPNGEKAAAPLGHRARLTGHYDPATSRIDYDGSMPTDWQTWLDTLPAAMLGQADTPARYFYARIWRAPTVGNATDQASGANIVLPETGIALHFNGNGIAGDYWTAALRPNAPESIHPWKLLIDPAAGDVPIAAPTGPRRFHAGLALVTWPNPLGGAPVIEDCRNRFRSLCRIKSCCTYQVGDGHRTWGDFNMIQEAIDALPAEGGEICLLPGDHTGAIDLTKRHDIKIHGCGPRTRIDIAADPANPDLPGVTLEHASGIRFEDFRITGHGGPVFAATGFSGDITFLRLQIGTARSAAIALAQTHEVAVQHCEIVARALAQALTPADLPALMPLVYLAGQNLAIADTSLSAQGAQNRNRVALGGLQIGGGSSNVRIERNQIEGGNGHGITLGSIERQVIGGDGGKTFGIDPWLTVDDDGCIKVRPGGTFETPPKAGETRVQSGGPVDTLRIRDNMIAGHGLCGISVAHWFIPNAKLDIAELDDIEIDEVEITGNRIHKCMHIDLVSSLPVDAAFNIGFGGVALASATDIRLADNEIRDCGSQGRTPMTGIYIRYSERLRITGNRISENGRPASLTDPLLVGNIGGIVIGHVDGVEEGLGVQLREVPAAVIMGNTVVTPEGRALELTGAGQMLVQGNALTSHGNNVGGVLLQILFALLKQPDSVGDPLVAEEIEGQYRAALALIGGSSVLILNTGVNRNLALVATAASAFLPKAAQESAAAEAPAEAAPAGAAAEEVIVTRSATDDSEGFSVLAPQTGFGFDNGLLRARRDPDGPAFPPRGPVSFSDNMVTFDAISPAITLSLCSVAIISFDDVGMHDNHCAMDLTTDFVLANALVLGLASVRVQGNRFREVLPFGLGQRKLPLPTTIFSAITLGILNATEMNQGTYCFLALGFKKPQVLLNTATDTPTARLDTNRHMLPDEFCSWIDKLFGDD